MWRLSLCIFRQNTSHRLHKAQNPQTPGLNARCSLQSEKCRQTPLSALLQGTIFRNPSGLQSGLALPEPLSVVNNSYACSCPQQQDVFCSFPLTIHPVLNMIRQSYGGSKPTIPQQCIFQSTTNLKVSQQIFSIFCLTFFRIIYVFVFRKKGRVRQYRTQPSLSLI